MSLRQLGAVKKRRKIHWKKKKEPKAKWEKQNKKCYRMTSIGDRFTHSETIRWRVARTFHSCDLSSLFFFLSFVLFFCFAFFFAVTKKCNGRNKWNHWLRDRRVMKFHLCDVVKNVWPVWMKPDGHTHQK